MAYVRVNLRKTHPFLHRSITWNGIASIGLAVNFWTSTPAFNPFGIPKTWVGVVFFVAGVALLVFHNGLHHLLAVRRTLLVSFVWTGSWGLLNTDQFFNGPASLQNPILLASIAVWQLLSLIEAPINPMTERK